LFQDVGNRGMINIDRNTFESLFNQYYSGLIVYANRFTNQTEVSEDIVHDVFISLWEKRNSLLMESAKAYLFSSVRNRCLNHLEQLKVRNEYQEQLLQKGDITGLLTWEYYVESELREHIEKAIRQLPPQCQKIFIMNRFDGKSIAQIAEELEISPRTAEKHIEVALKKLRQELADYLPTGLLFWILNI
jgi:RNA polymerase sigma-70 factor (family 1)